MCFSEFLTSLRLYELAISGGHYSGALFSVGGQRSIMIHTGNSDGVYTIYIAIVCTTVSL